RHLAERQRLSSLPPDRRAEVHLRDLWRHHRPDDALPPDRAHSRAQAQARGRGGTRGRAAKPVRFDVRSAARRAGGRAEALAMAAETRTEPTGNLLVASSVRKEFGGLLAVNDLDFTIPQRSIV